MHERAHYTIGYLTGWHPTPKSGIYYEFNFTVAGTTYKSSGPGKVKLPIIAGTRFVVKYDSSDPTSNVGYFELPVPDTVRRAPPAGWRRPTFPLPQWVLDMGKNSYSKDARKASNCLQ